jgi:hypothetical protein
MMLALQLQEEEEEIIQATKKFCSRAAPLYRVLSKV